MSSIARGGLMFMLLIWLQGIWLPQHGYSFTDTPLWAGIYMLPLTLGLICAGPISGYLSDRFGARPFATAGMLLNALGFFLLLLLPTNFSYAPFGLILLLIGVSMGLFASPNRAAVMNSLPGADRGAGGAMNQTFQNSAQVLSIGVFFTLLIVGLASTLPETMSAGLEAHNPIEHLLGPDVMAGLSAHDHAVLTGNAFFPTLISAPFRDGLHAAFAFAIVACLIAGAASLMRGGHSVQNDPAPASARLARGKGTTTADGESHGVIPSRSPCMYPTSSVVTTITTDRLREAEAARRASPSNNTQPAKPGRSRGLRSLATRIAAPGLR